MNHFIIKNRQAKNLAIQVYERKNAPVIIFSNSLGTDHRMWEAQVEALQDAYTIITYDTRGHGQSEVITETSLQSLAEDVIDILDYLSIDKAHFCGISMGGITALCLAIHYPERFYSITVANSAAKIGNTEAWCTRAEQVKQTGLAELAKTTHTRWFSPQFNFQQHVLAQQTIQSLASTPVNGYANACHALAHADLREQISHISIPTLIIAGQDDPVTTVADGMDLLQHIPNSQLSVLQASHLSNIEKPKDFTQQFRKFIEAYSIN